MYREEQEWKSDIIVFQKEKKTKNIKNKNIILKWSKSIA